MGFYSFSTKYVELLRCKTVLFGRWWGFDQKSAELFLEYINMTEKSNMNSYPCSVDERQKQKIWSIETSKQ